MTEERTNTSTRASCPHCQHPGQLDTIQLQQLLEKTSIICEKCDGDMILASEEQLRRFEKFGNTGIAFMLVVVASALTVVVAIALKWLGVIRGDTQMMTSVIATAVGAISLLLAKSASEFTFELQPAPTQQKQTQAE